MAIYIVTSKHHAKNIFSLVNELNTIFSSEYYLLEIISSNISSMFMYSLLKSFIYSCLNNYIFSVAEIQWIFVSILFILSLSKSDITHIVIKKEPLDGQHCF